MKTEYIDSIAIFKNLIDSTVCENLIDLFENTDTFEDEKLEIHNRNDLSKRYKFNQTKDLKILKKNLDSCLNLYSLRFNGLLDYSIRNDVLCKIQKTPLYGGFHSWHQEHGYEEPHRVLVWMVYLNDLDEEDGTTEFLYQNLALTPSQGTVVLWPAYFTHRHRGNPPRKKVKYIATGWYCHVEEGHPFDELKHNKDWKNWGDYV